METNPYVQTLSKHKEEIRERFGVSKIGLFGSCAEGRESEESDVDIYVEFNRKSFDNLAGLWVYLEELFQRRVDLVYPRKPMNGILRNIQESVIYG